MFTYGEADDRPADFPRTPPPLARLLPQSVARLLTLLLVVPGTFSQFSDYPDNSTVFVHLEDPGPALFQPPTRGCEVLVACHTTSTTSPMVPSSTRELYYDFVTVYIRVKLLFVTTVSTLGCQVLVGHSVTSTASPTEPSSNRQLYYFTAGYLEVDLLKAVYLHYCDFLASIYIIYINLCENPVKCFVILLGYVIGVFQNLSRGLAILAANICSLGP